MGELGGLSGRLRLILFDLRGTGGSETPEDAASFRCDHLVDDLEALREHLGLDRMDLLAHCAGANLAVLYAVRYPERIGRLALITPSTRAVGILATDENRREVADLRKSEPWFRPASAALGRIAAGQAEDADWAAIAPFTYGRWDDAAQAHHASGDEQRNAEAAAFFFAEGAFNPERTRAALATFGARVLILAGEFDVAAPPPVMAEFAGLFPNAALVIHPRAGHFPWLDDPGRFAKTVTAFLGADSARDLVEAPFPTRSTTA